LPKAISATKLLQTFFYALLILVSGYRLILKGVWPISNSRQTQPRPTMNNEADIRFAGSSPAMRTIFPGKTVNQWWPLHSPNLVTATRMVFDKPGNVR
jgi:hypothetical protein